MKRYVYGKIEKIMDACSDLDALKEDLKNDFSAFDMPFDNFNFYTSTMYIENYAVLASVREDDFAPLFFFLYVDDSDNIRAYIPSVGQIIKINNGKCERKAIDDEITEMLVRLSYSEPHPKIQEMARKFRDNIAATHSEVEKVVVMNDGGIDELKKAINKAKKYFNSISVSSENGFFGLFAEDFYRVTNFDSIDSLKITKYMVYNDRPLAVAKIKRNGDESYTVFIYRSVEENTSPYKSGRLRMFIPLYGNTLEYSCIPHVINSANKNKDIPKQNLDKMLEDFVWYSTVDMTTKPDCECFTDVNGVVADMYRAYNHEPIVIGMASKSDVEKIHNEDEVVSFINKYFDKNLQKDEYTIEHTLDFYGSYVISNRVTVNGYYPIMVYEYIDENGGYAITVSKQNNYVCDGKAIPSKYGAYVNFGETEVVSDENEEKGDYCQVYKDNFFAPRQITKNDEANIGEVFEVRHAKPNSANTLANKVNDVNDLGIREDDFREEIESIDADYTIHHYNGLDYMMMNAVNADGEHRKIAFFIDVMNRARAFIAYNTEYAKEEFEASIIPSKAMF
jgi:hypothetical protein